MSAQCGGKGAVCLPEEAWSISHWAIGACQCADGMWKDLFRILGR